MLKYISSVCAAAMVLSLPLMTPGFAMPRTMPAQAVQADMMLVQHDRGNRNWRNDRRGGDRNWNRGPQQNRHWNRPAPNRHASRDWERRGNNYYYRGHRGYRDHRPGYRQHNGWWFPPAAFIAGAIIGGAMIAEPPIQYRPRGNAHISWCYSRYKSYRASDNSFQPYNGPRRQCVSPYG